MRATLLRFNDRHIIPLVLILTLVTGSSVSIQVTVTPGISDSADLPHTSLSCPDCQLVDVLRVIDGDTLDTSIGRLRLFGVDTLERGDVCAADATELTRRLGG